MQIAIIDLGTNSVRFDVHELSQDGSTNTLYREKVMIRLGEGVFLKGRLDKNSMRRALTALITFKKIITGLHVKKVIAVGTSALREAQNGSWLIQEIKKYTGIEIRIISGLEEAKLIATGILKNECIGNKKIGFIDIGGGSTEITICRGKKILRSESFPIGTARLQQLFLKQAPPTTQAVRALRRYVQKTLSNLFHNHWPSVTEFLGSSGTIRALTKLNGASEGKDAITVRDLKKLIRKTQYMTAIELLKMPGMEPKRADMILSGALLLRFCMKALNVERTIPTDYALRDGILEEQLALQKKQGATSFVFRLSDLHEKIIRFGETELHIQGVARLTSRLFQGLQTLHGLNSTWKIYLETAVLLRNSGEMISFLNHPEHSYYVVKHADFPFAKPWETEMVASLCRYHEIFKLGQTKEFPFQNDKFKKRVFLKLLAILCVVDALDTNPLYPVKIKKLWTKKDVVKISLSGGTALEPQRVAKRSRLFKSVFKKGLVVQLT